VCPLGGVCKFILSISYLYLVLFLRQTYSTLSNGMFLNSGSSRSRSLKMGPSDKSYTTSYWSAKHCTIVEFDVEEWCDFDGSLRSLEMASLDRSHTSSCSFSVFHCNYDPILYRFREKARYWSKSRFFITLLYWENGCEYFRAVFFTTEPGPWLIRWCK